MAATYDNLGLQFLYPENWTIVEQSQGEMYSASVTLQSPGTSCWTVHRYPSTCSQKQLVEQLVAVVLTARAVKWILQTMVLSVVIQRGVNLALIVLH